ncbi:DNA excision repair protein ERCC-1 [Actinidia eriantha]|uniref:DNA excision repair protein ERCC-1 n=1 Tax=Actinidia eriantha TaxID=165200 RepID=UPI0025866C06|nr:DNA excision repair protein ERCC-1 [Actinidia eriantha]
MEDEEEREQEDDRRRRDEREKNNPFVIKIPSYQQVLESSHSQTSQPSLFTPSPSFSQAFNFIKSSEFYTPPPEVSSTTPPPSAAAAAASRNLDQSEAPSSSSSSSAVASSSTSQVAHNRNAILVSHRQKGNPLLKHIRNVRWDFADVVCDYLLGQSTCALYLSLRYHLLHPDYLYYRIRELQKNFKLRVVLCHVDVEDVVKPLLEVTKTALLHDCTLLCAWSLEECGRYLETIKVYENKPADIIQGQMDTDYLSRLTHALTTVRHVNKTDVVTLGSTFGSLSHVMDASMEDLARCPGIGERKVKRLYDTFHEPFKRVVPKHLSAPETSTQNNVEPTLASEGKDEKEEANKRGKKETETTIKSALSAAFSKYSDKIGKKNNNSQQEKIDESSSAGEAKAKNKNSREEAAI